MYDLTIKVNELRKYGYNKKVDLRRKLTYQKKSALLKKYNQLQEHLQTYYKPIVFKKTKRRNRSLIKKIKNKNGLTSFNTIFIPKFTTLKSIDGNLKLKHLSGKNVDFIPINYDFYTLTVSITNRVFKKSVIKNVVDNILKKRKDDIGKHISFAMKTGDYYRNQIESYSNYKDLVNSVTDFFLDLVESEADYYSELLQSKDIYNGIYIFNQKAKDKNLIEVDELSKEIKRRF